MMRIPGLASARPLENASPASNAPPTAHIASLDGVRFLLAAHVMLYHAALNGFFQTTPGWKRFLVSGQMDVSFFFTISGFIMVYNYARPGQVLHARRFLVARLARVYPAYLLSMVLLAHYHFVHQHTPLQFSILSGLAYLLMVQAWIPAFFWTWNSLGWSVSAEAFFYLVFPKIAKILARPISDRALIASLVVCAVLRGVLGILFVAAADVVVLGDSAQSFRDLPLLRSTTIAALGPELLTFLPLIRLPEFILGTILGVLYFRHRERVPRGVGIAALTCGCLAIGLLFACFPASWITRPIFRSTILSSLFVPANVAVLFGVLHLTPSGEFAGSRFLKLLGDLSYGVFIYHTAIFYWSKEFLHVKPGGGVTLIGTFAAIIGFAYISYRWFEKPIRDRVNRLVRKIPVATLPPAVAEPATAGAGPK